MNYTITRVEDHTNIALFHDGNTYVADNSHPNYNEIRAALLSEDESVVDLFDLQKSIAERFERLSERVTVANGNVYFDGDVVDNAVTKHILRSIEESRDDLSAHVNFLEKVEQNPNPESVKELYTWLNSNEFTLTSEGDIVAYKGVTGDYLSVYTGTATVDGEVITGKIPYKAGSLIEMPRSEVVYDPNQACNVGLHAANFKFAKAWGCGPIMQLRVNPRDVVSVPRYEAQKMRVCRYYVVGEVNKEFKDAIEYATVERGCQCDYEEEPCYCCCECGGDEDTCLCDSSTVTDPQCGAGCQCDGSCEGDWESEGGSYEPEDEDQDARYHRPTAQEVLRIKTLAKARKRGFVRTAKQIGWELEDEDNPDNPGSWIIWES